MKERYINPKIPVYYDKKGKWYVKIQDVLMVEKGE